MSHETAPAKPLSFKALGNAGFLVGLLGGATLIGVALSDKMALKNVIHSWTFAWAFVMALALGCFGFTLLHHTVRGSWGAAVIRLFEAGGGALALFVMALLFIPIAMNLTIPYDKWVNIPAGDTMVLHKEVWLNPLGFGVRFCIYFAIWIGLAWGLRKSSMRQDANGDINEQHRRTNWSAIGLVIFVLSVTLAATDWFMSMDPHWFSTIFGPLYMIVGANMALALCTAIVCLNRERAPYRDVVSKDLTRDLGNLCFAFTMLWIYFSLSQFLIIWSGNLPEFTSFYYRRQYESTFLLGLGAANVIFGWFIPWLALLAPRTKAGPKLLITVCLGIVGMRVIDIYWTVMPFMRKGDALPVWTDGVALLTMLGFWLWAFGKTTEAAPLVPNYDTRLQEALHYEHA